MKGCMKYVKTKIVNELTSPGWNCRPQSTCHFSPSGGTPLHIYTLFATYTYLYLCKRTSPRDPDARLERSETFPPRRDSFQRTRGAFLSGAFKMTMIRDTGWGASASSSASFASRSLTLSRSVPPPFYPTSLNPLAAPTSSPLKPL